MQRREKIRRITFLAVLVSIILLMSFTPIGYIKILPLSLEITLITIPVVIGAILLGPIAGLILGALFGITSFLQCVLGLSPFGATLLTINPFLTFIVCVVPRTLMGLFAGLIYQGLKKANVKNVIAHIITNVVGPILNTVLFMTALCLCFYQTDFIQGIATSINSTNVISFIVLFVGINGLVEAIVNVIVGSAVTEVLEATNLLKTK